jgi:hypothetical protein
MKNLYTLILAVLLTATTFAQAPEKMSYQAVVRDNGDALIKSLAVGMQISILQGSASGTAVYIETQTPTTNANGLVTLEIGAGTTTDDFTTIDWSAGPYFIKTEIDVDNNASYDITGTSQLLSVPYALHAKTAGSTTETQTLASVVALGNTANNLQIKELADPTEAQDATTKAYVDALEAKLTDIEANIAFLNHRTLRIGDLKAGGVVFYIAPEPTDLDGDGDLDSGLVCAFSDYESPVEWGCYGKDLPSVPNTIEVPGATQRDLPVLAGAGFKIGDGMNNTNAILLPKDCPTSPAALAARSLGPEWFLPSLNEFYSILDALPTLESVPGFSSFTKEYIYYWSSTEYDSNRAWVVPLNFDFIIDNKLSNKNVALHVRAVRAF